MKKAFLFFAGALLLAGCAKETETKEDTGVKTYTITASVDNLGTRSTADVNEDGEVSFTWGENESIAVIPEANSLVLPFIVANADDGTFSYTSMGDEDEYESFIMAVSPASALDPEVIVDGSWAMYNIIYSGDYVQEQSNAIMVAGTPTTGSDGTQHFQFRHIGGLVKVSYTNVPAGTKAMVFSTQDNPITGVFEFEEIANIEAKATSIGGTTGNEATVRFTTAPTSEGPADFYLPIPTGSYQTFTVKLIGADDNDIDGSEQTFTAPSAFTVKPADVILCPEVTVTPPCYVKVSSDDNLTSGQYLIVYEAGSLAFNGGLTTLDASSNSISVTITNDVIPSNSGTDAASFTISIGTESSTIKSASGYYIGNNSDSNSLSANKTTQFENTIRIGQNGEADIVSKGGAYLRYNATSGQERFRYFKSSTYTAQKAIALYKLSSSTAPVTQKELENELYISGNIKKQFNLNEAFSFGEGVVKATYTNGESKTLTVSDVTVSGFNSSSASDSQSITLTYTEGGKTATGTYNVQIIGTVTGAKYKRVSTLTAGKKYLIAAGNGDSYVMPHPVSSQVQDGVQVSIANDEIASTAETDACAFTISQKTVNSVSYYVITYVSNSTTYYVAGASSSNTSLKSINQTPSNVSSLALWTITKSSTGYGSFNIKDAGATSRSILWRPSDSNNTWLKFGHYNGSGNSTYYNVELYEYTVD